MSTTPVDEDRVESRPAYVGRNVLDYVPGVVLLVVIGLLGKGWRPLVVAIVGLVVVATVSLGLVLLTSRVFHWGVNV